MEETKTQEPTKSAEDSVAVSEMKKQLHAGILKQIEYYFSDENLKQDEFFHNIIKNSPVGAIPVESLLNCNKIKKLNVSKDDIMEAVANSEELEHTGDGTGVKRKNPRPLPEFEPKVGKKVKIDKKSNGGNHEGPKGSFEAKVFKLTLSNGDHNLKWNDVQAEIEKEFGKVNYTRLNGAEGHIAVNQKNVSIDTLQKLCNGVVKVGDVEVKIQDCLGDDLKSFYNDHGRHLDMCLERAGLKKKDKRGQKSKEGGQEHGNKDLVDFVFYNQRYTSLQPLKYVFKSIMQKSTDDEVINEADHKLLLELLKYHDNYEEKVKDLKHFTVGPHPSYKQTRCFFIVRNDGTKEDFSSTKCIDNLKNKYKLADEDEKDNEKQDQ